MIRQLIREMLLREELAGFKKRTKEINYMSSFDDPTFDYQEPWHKLLAKDVKRAWAAEADHEFMKSLIKVHWANGFDWEGDIERFLSLKGNNEISAMGYLPDSKRVSSSWGEFGVLIQGRVTLAANDMNTINSGYFKNVSDEITSKYKSSGIPRRSTMFGYGQDGYGSYIVDKESFDPERSRRNEIIVDNWKPIGFVIGVGGAGWKAGDLTTLKYAKFVLNHNLPFYTRDMTLIDREELKKALDEKMKDEDF